MSSYYILQKQDGKSPNAKIIGEVNTLPDGRVKMIFGGTVERAFQSLCALCDYLGLDIQALFEWGTSKNGQQFRFAI